LVQKGAVVNKIEFGDCRETMRRWKEQGIKAQTCVTSPPYFGLRDYGHEGQLGLEETPEDYIKAMVEVFRCVWDVLEDNGTLWLNIGDSYARNGGGVESKMNTVHKMGVGQKATYLAGGMQSINKVPEGLKSKDLIGIPWMMAFALRADGWYLRQDIIWHKPNPMPESVQDRCTKAHEYIFLMSKSQKYHYDMDAMKEPAEFGEHHAKYSGTYTRHKVVAMQSEGATNGENYQRGMQEAMKDPLHRNKRSVWTVTTKPYAGAHFAVFPTELIEPCILAGAPVGGIVLDPFMGSGTTAQVAQNLGRQYIGCELNPAYLDLQNIRTAQQSFGFEA
jgi:DNA modification methylase